MTQPSAALVKSDLASVRIVGEGAARWEITPLPGAEVTARSLRARADEAARWIAMQPAIKRRLGVVVVDVDESICAWLRTPSLAQPVVAATLRSNAQDWGDLMPVASYEALVSPQPASKKRGKKGELPAPESDGGVSIGVLCMPDAILRLWLDALDSMNVRVGTIMSLWHAMARVWPGESSGVTASVLIDGDQRLVWAWSQGGELLCGSVVTLMGAAPEESGPPAEAQETTPAPADETGDALAASAKRLTLDWLTWSSHLGRVPEKVQIIGMGADKLASSLREHWSATRFDARSHSDPVEHTLQQLIATIDDKNADDPRRTLTRLTHRPTRAVRTRYRLTAATLILSAICLGLVGQRLVAASKDMAEREAVVRQQTREEARKEVPEIPPTGTAFELRQLLEAAANKPVESFKPPPTPRPIYEEFQRIAGILEKYPEVRILGIVFDQEATGQCRLQLRAPDRRTATEIFEAIKGTGKPVLWTRQQSGAGAAGAFDDLNVVGQWVN